MNILLWILQALLAVVFVLHGWLYVSWSPEREEQMRQRRPNYKPLPFPDWFRTFVGVAELLAAVGLLLPGVTGILPWLTPPAAAGLVVTMIGAVALHLSRRETLSVIGTVILLLMAALISYVRWQVIPL